METFMRINRKQVRALHQVAATGPGTSVLLQQTRTETGGTHLYVHTGGRVYHVAASSGRVQECG